MHDVVFRNKSSVVQDFWEGKNALHGSFRPNPLPPRTQTPFRILYIIFSPLSLHTDMKMVECRIERFLSSTSWSSSPLPLWSSPEPLALDSSRITVGIRGPSWSSLSQRPMRPSSCPSSPPWTSGRTDSWDWSKRQPLASQPPSSWWLTCARWSQ